MARKKAAGNPADDVDDEQLLRRADRKMPRHREIAVSEFFSKNRHLLGFDSPQKALLTAVREAVDNALDACEEARILPDIAVELTQIDDTKFRVRIEDNGPGIPRSEIGKIFAKLLYGSKFHRLKQSRGQQGIGISAAVMYAQMTTGEPAHVTSKMVGGRAHRMKLFIDTAKNKPQVESEDFDTGDWWKAKPSGTAIELLMTASFKGGRHGIEAYLKQTALANPHTRIVYRGHRVHAKGGDALELPRVVHVLPIEPKEIKPHPHGVELGTLQRMLLDVGNEQTAHFFAMSFSRVTTSIAADICRTAKVSPTAVAGKLTRTEGEALYNAIKAQKLMAPPTSCLSPIGEAALIQGLYALYGDARDADEEDDELLGVAARGLAKGAGAVAAVAPLAVPASDVAKAAPPKGAKKKLGKAEPPVQPQLGLFARAAPPAALPEPGVVVGEVGDEKPVAGKARIQKDEDGGAVLALGDNMFVTAVTRPPTVYRGNPFQVECGILYSKSLPADELARVFRFANRVPLLYQASACAMSKAVISAPWRSYEVQQSKGAMPTGPLVILSHIASAWVPYTSESKEAIAHYPEVLKEMRLAIMEAGRRLQRFLRRRKREVDEEKKKGYITRYLDPIGEALQEILGLTDAQRVVTLEQLKEVLEKSRSPGKPGDDDKPRPPTESAGPGRGPSATGPDAAPAKRPAKAAAPKARAKPAAPSTAPKAAPKKRRARGDVAA